MKKLKFFITSLSFKIENLHLHSIKLNLNPTHSNFKISRRILIFISLFFYEFLMMAFTNQALASDWKIKAVEDLKFIRDELYKNHMGPFDVENLGFNNWLHNGLEKATLMADRVKSQYDYELVLRFYLNGFNDNHLILYAGGETPMLTPGFNVEYKNGKLVVAKTVRDSLMETGDEIISCDNKDISTLYREYVEPYYGLDSSEADYKININRIFETSPNSFNRMIENCVIKRIGLKFNININWRVDRLPQEITPNFSVNEIEDSSYWIKIPTFKINDKNRENIQNLISEIKNKKIGDNAKKIILDMRGNGGGSSGWGDAILESIWEGKDFKRAYRRKYDYIEWRVSEKSISEIEYWLSYWEKLTSKNSEQTKYYTKILESLKDSNINGLKTFKEYPEDGDYEVLNVKQEVYLLTDSHCFSACLDFADVILSMKSAIHIGEETRADAIYIDNTKVRLPSGNSQLSYSMKAYRGRYRENNQSYKPGIEK